MSCLLFDKLKYKKSTALLRLPYQRGQNFVFKRLLLYIFFKVHERERNYTVCYVAFTFFMIGTMLVATKLPFDYPPDEHAEQQQTASTVMTPHEASIIFFYSFIFIAPLLVDLIVFGYI